MRNNRKRKGDLPYWLELVIGATVWVIFLALWVYTVLEFVLTP